MIVCVCLGLPPLLVMAAPVEETPVAAAAAVAAAGVHQCLDGRVGGLKPICTVPCVCVGVCGCVWVCGRSPGVDDEALWNELFGADAEALESHVEQLLVERREGAHAIKRALRILHIAVMDATEANGEDPELKLAALVQLVGEAVSELDPDGEGVADSDMSDSHG